MKGGRGSLSILSFLLVILISLSFLCIFKLFWILVYFCVFAFLLIELEITCFLQLFLLLLLVLLLLPFLYFQDVRDKEIDR